MRGSVLACFSIGLCLFVLCLPALSAPVPPVGPVDVEGTVLRVVWFPESWMKGNPGMSGTAGHDRTMPARFRVFLRDYRGMEKDAILLMKDIHRWSASDKLDKSGFPEYIVLQIPHRDRTLLKEGMRIRIRGYTIAGDEGGDWSSYKDIEILPGSGGR